MRYVPSPEDFCPVCKMPSLYVIDCLVNDIFLKETRCLCGCDLEPLPIEEVAS